MTTSKPHEIEIAPDDARKLIGQFEHSIQVMSGHNGMGKAIEAARKRIAELQAAL